MINFMLGNLSTIIISLLLLLIIVMIIKNQFKTKHTCGSGCGGCPMAGKCHSNEKATNKN